MSGRNCDRAIAGAAGSGNVARSMPDQLAGKLVGDSLYRNPLMPAYAVAERPRAAEPAAVMRTIELNGVEVEKGEQQARVRMGPRAADTTSHRCRRGPNRPQVIRVRQRRTSTSTKMIAKSASSSKPIKTVRMRRPTRIRSTRCSAVEALAEHEEKRPMRWRAICSSGWLQGRVRVASLHTTGLLARWRAVRGGIHAELQPRPPLTAQKTKRRAAEV